MFRTIAKKYWETTRYHQWQLFFALCILLVCSAPAIPNIDSREFSVYLRLLFLVIGLTFVTYSTSLGCYFFDSWRKHRSELRPTAYHIWLGFETLVGVPFAGLCMWAGVMVLFVVFFR